MACFDPWWRQAIMFRSGGVVRFGPRSPPYVWVHRTRTGETTGWRVFCHEVHIDSIRPAEGVQLAVWLGSPTCVVRKSSCVGPLPKPTGEVRYPKPPVHAGVFIALSHVAQ
jgi:hypothetical protein